MFCSHFPSAFLVSFLPEGRKKSEILLASIALHLGIVLAVFLVAVPVFYLFPAARFWTAGRLGSEPTRWALCFLAGLSPSIVLQSTLLAFVTGLQKIKLGNRLAMSLEKSAESQKGREVLIHTEVARRRRAFSYRPQPSR